MLNVKPYTMLQLNEERQMAFRVVNSQEICYEMLSSRSFTGALPSLVWRAIVFRDQEWIIAQLETIDRFNHHNTINIVERDAMESFEGMLAAFNLEVEEEQVSCKTDEDCSESQHKHVGDPHQLSSMAEEDANSKTEK